MLNEAFRVLKPQERASCVVFASPHSGRSYSPAFLNSSVLDSHAIRSSEDAFVDQLFEIAPQFGAPLLMATAPRAYVDLNRAADELDPALIDGLRMRGHNPRVASGLGVIPRVVSNGRAIYRGKISQAEAHSRIDQVWRPYHAKLQQLLDDAYRDFGEAILIDCHSMPHEAMDGISKGSMRRPDVVLGDRFGAAARNDIVDQIEEAFRAQGFTVTRNTPFAGAYVTQAYGRPSRKQHAVQVEIDRSIYMDERRIAPNSQFDSVRSRLAAAISDIASLGRTRIPLAAE